MTRHARNDRRPLAIVLAALVALAWLLLWVWGQSPYARYLSHHDLGAVRGGGILMVVFVLGWTLMIVAMMLPTSLPLIVLFGTLTRQRSDRLGLIVLLVAGYLGIWTLFGVAVYLVDAQLHYAVEQLEWVARRSWLLGAATLILAGVYQFTPLKSHCLERCRSPLSFIMEHWRGRRERLQSFLLGVHHGIFCIGCCWSLMLVTFAVGVGNLGWMLLLGIVMAVEKNLPWGLRLSAPLGVSLIGYGLLVVVRGG